MTEPDLDVAACVERVRQRDEEAARRRLQHLYPLVIKLVWAHLPRRTSEEDLMQVVFMKIFASLGQHSGAVPLEHWVTRIAERERDCDPSPGLKLRVDNEQKNRNNLP